MGFFDLFSKNNKKETLDKGLERTKQGVFSKIARAIAGKKNIDDDFLDELEEIFVTSDVGVDTTLRIIERLQARVKRDGYVGTSELPPSGIRLQAVCNHGGGSERRRQDNNDR